MLVTTLFGCATQGQMSSVPAENVQRSDEKTWRELLKDEQKRDAYNSALSACDDKYFDSSWKDKFLMATIVLAPIGLLNMGLRGLGYLGCATSVAKPEGIYDLTADEKKARLVIFHREFTREAITEWRQFSVSYQEEASQLVGRGEQAIWLREKFIYLTPLHLFISLNRYNHVGRLMQDIGYTAHFSYSKSGKLKMVELGHMSATYFISRVSGIYLEPHSAFASVCFDEVSGTRTSCGNSDLLSDEDAQLLKNVGDEIFGKHIARAFAN